MFIPQNFLKDKKIAIQGAGSVGKRLAEYLASSGAKVFISDIDQSKLDKIIIPDIQHDYREFSILSLAYVSDTDGNVY